MKIINIDNKIHHFKFLIYVFFLKHIYLNSSILILSIILSIYYSSYTFIFILFIILFKLIYDTYKYKYDNLFGLAIYPKYIFIYKNKIKTFIEYDFVLLHELYHLYQFKTLHYSKLFEKEKIELDADKFALKILYLKYSIKEIDYLLNNYFFFHK